MTQIYEMEEKDFKKILESAYEKDLITDIQREALLAKFERKAEGEPLTIQNRNALRLLRNSLAHNLTTLSEIAKQSLKIEKTIELLAFVDKQSGLICNSCKNGILVKRTVSSWNKGNGYELILEQKPAQVCSNNLCKTTYFDIAIEKKEEEIFDAVEKQLLVIKATKPESSDLKKCPICRSDALLQNPVEEIYRYRQGLYHIRIEKVPLKTYCSLCGHKEIGEKVAKELTILEELLETKVLGLLNEV